MVKNVLAVLAVAGLGLAGCDQSKAELDSTKTQLTAVTAERDGLKTQLAAAQAQVKQLQAAAATAAAAAAAAPPPAATPPAPPPKPDAKKGHHAK